MSYTALENQMRSIISNLPSGEKFFLRDIIPNPSAQLGRTLYEEVKTVQSSMSGTSQKLTA